MVGRYPWVVLDNEAGLENLSRRLVNQVDLLVIVTDPSARGILTVRRLHALAREMGIVYARLVIVVNRLRRPSLPDGMDSLKIELAAHKVVGLTDDEALYGIAEGTGNLRELPARIAKLGEEKLAAACETGVPTLRDIVTELQKPGRDIRDSLPPPLLREGIMEIGDLAPGMELQGTVRNVIDFGVFVDIGVHQDGLVHISELSDRYVKHPSEVVQVGDVVRVRVLGADPVKKRISLTMKLKDAQSNA
jgi:hypothetical protein